ncbi:MAG: hypothetical protein CBD58_01060, partial [bacterium TMED198]
MLDRHLESKLSIYAKRLDKNLDKLSILVCISGGVDSSVLLNIMFMLRSKFKFKLNAAHVNYSFHNKSDLMSKHCYKI